MVDFVDIDSRKGKNGYSGSTNFLEIILFWCIENSLLPVPVEEEVVVVGSRANINVARP